MKRYLLFGFWSDMANGGARDLCYDFDSAGEVLEYLFAMNEICTDYNVLDTKTGEIRDFYDKDTPVDDSLEYNIKHKARKEKFLAWIKDNYE